MLNRSWLFRMGIMAALAVSACSSDSPTEPDPPKPPVDPDEVVSPAQEARALWVSRYDWTTQGELLEMLDSAAAANFNIIYFQARTRADAYYQSNLEPWAHRSNTGPFTLGKNPGWDPLAVALSRARANGLQLHVWVNAFIGWCGSEPIPETTPRHILLQHPEWRMLTQSGSPNNSENCTFLSPGHPAARTHLARVAADIVRNYAVDGIHLDYIRYPDTSMSWDSASVAEYEKARTLQPALSYDQFRRDRVTLTVREVRDSMRAARRNTVLSAAVWGVWQNTAGWSGISTGYTTRFQDSRGWLQLGIIDAIVPMAYWPIKPTYGDRLDFAWLADDFARNTFNRHVYMGMGVPVAAENFCTGCDVVKQIYQTRRAKAQGIAVFRARLLNPSGWNAIRKGPFKFKVPVPTPPAANYFE